VTGEQSSEAPREKKRRRLLLLLLVLLALLGLTAASVEWRRGAFSSSSSDNPSGKSGLKGARKLIDRTAPMSPTISSNQSDPTSQTDASFSFTSSSPDAAGYLCRIDSSAYAACSGSKSYSNLSQGSHTFAVETTDAAGNTSNASSVIWVVDTTPPPDPAITSHPTSSSRSSDATLAFSDAEAGVTFECSLDGGAWMSCDSPQVYASLAGGSHAFSVRAVDTAGNRSGEASFAWRIVSASASSTVRGGGNSVAQVSGINFKIAGAVANLTMERTKVIPLTLTNPNGKTIYVTALTVNASADSVPPGCESKTNLDISQSNTSSVNPIAVPAKGKVTLTSAPRAPQVTLLDLPGVNQDACKNASFALTYSGSAHS
jgi:outer membrane lipoprotein SlyB